MPAPLNEKKPNAQESAARRLALLCSVLAGLLLFCALPLFPRLAVSGYADGRRYLALPVREGEVISIRYTHSVNLSDVTDTLACSGGKLVLKSTLFSAYGAGMPLPEEIGGTAFSHTEEGFLITGMDRVEEALLIMLQEVPNHRLLYRGEEINLLSLAGSGTILRIGVRPVSLFSILLQEIKNQRGAL